MGFVIGELVSEGGLLRSATRLSIRAAGEERGHGGEGVSRGLKVTRGV